MSRWEIITNLALWGMIFLQWLTIKDLKKRIENEKKWSAYWRDLWLTEKGKTNETN